ncbi:M36 family metallopeptidase [Dokdonella sp. MW10]|uniref:M36 family metallopeptidase n=1 Tax=Dokdonella sp. MW10 TaxID=2992926 RepID=UPI003F7E8D03
MPTIDEPTCAGVPRAVMALAAPVLACIAGAAHAAGYRAFPAPVESPNHGIRAWIGDPHDPVASPFGWHDTDGIAGPEYTTLRGNNVHVYVDTNADGVPDGPGPDGGPALTFDAPYDASWAPSAYHDALAVNTFYWTNHLHDVFLRHGFTPARGNMQANTYGQAGMGGDPLRVEVSRGSAVSQFNNVSYAYAADGTSPSLRQFVWNTMTPNRESSFDASGTTWAYGVLMYARLTSNCIQHTETPHVGFADTLALLATTDLRSVTATTPRGLGTYLVNQAPGGGGLRGTAYAVDMTMNPRSYASRQTLTPPHATGAIVASALWDLTLYLADAHGAQGDLGVGDRAESRMLRLLIEAMRTMPCPGGFVTARDAILLADQTLHGGQDRCLVWQAFARRGLGVGANEGSPASITDGTAATDMPVDCVSIFRNGFDPG